MAAAISRFASTLDGLRSGYLDDPTFAAIAASDRRDGRHSNPTGDPSYFTTAYFHRPEDLAEECAAAGLAHEVTLAVEGPGWLLPDLDARLADQRRRASLPEAIAALEAESTMLGVAHTSCSWRVAAEIDFRPSFFPAASSAIDSRIRLSRVSGRLAM